MCTTLQLNSFTNILNIYFENYISVAHRVVHLVIIKKHETHALKKKAE